MIVPREMYVQAASSRFRELPASNVDFDSILKMEFDARIADVSNLLQIPPGSEAIAHFYTNVFALYSIPTDRSLLERMLPWADQGVTTSMIRHYSRLGVLHFENLPFHKLMFKTDSFLSPDSKIRGDIEKEMPWLFSAMHAHIADVLIAEAKINYDKNNYDEVDALGEEACLHMVHAIELAARAKIIKPNEAKKLLSLGFEALIELGQDEDFINHVYPYLTKYISTLALNPIEVATIFEEMGLAAKGHANKVALQTAKVARSR